MYEQPSNRFANGKKEISYSLLQHRGMSYFHSVAAAAYRRGICRVGVRRTTEEHRA
jgi:hypothetical protein